MWMAFEVVAAKPKSDASDGDAPIQASMRESSAGKIRRNPSTDQLKVRRQMSKKAGAPEVVRNEDGEPLGWDYPSDPGEDDPSNGPDEGDYDWDDREASLHTAFDEAGEFQPGGAHTEHEMQGDPVDVAEIGDAQWNWDDDFAHEATRVQFTGALSDPTDIRPLHTRVATAFLKKG